jgi:hypothetical protein
VNPNLTPVTNYLVWKNDTETNLMDKYLPKEFKDRPVVELLNFLIIFSKIPLNSFLVGFVLKLLSIFDRKSFISIKIKPFSIIST